MSSITKPKSLNSNGADYAVFASQVSPWIYKPLQFCKFLSFYGCLKETLFSCIYILGARPNAGMGILCGRYKPSQLPGAPTSFVPWCWKGQEPRDVDKLSVATSEFHVPLGYLWPFPNGGLGGSYVTFTQREEAPACKGGGEFYLGARMGYSWCVFFSGRSRLVTNALWGRYGLYIYIYINIIWT